jgi:hypothetical protein
VVFKNQGWALQDYMALVERLTDVGAKNQGCWCCAVVFTKVHVQDGSFLVSLVVLLCE